MPSTRSRPAGWTPPRGADHRREGSLGDRLEYLDQPVGVAPPNRTALRPNVARGRVAQWTSPRGGGRSAASCCGERDGSLGERAMGDALDAELVAEDDTETSAVTNRADQ
jgi:hypothetical protein